MYAKAWFNYIYHVSLLAKHTLILCTYNTLVAEQLDPEEDTTEGICTQLRVCCTKLSCNFVTEILIAHNMYIQSGPVIQNTD